MARRQEETEEVNSSFSRQDIQAFRKSISEIVVSRYDNALSRYEMFLLSVQAINYYPLERKVTVSSYPDNQQDLYEKEYLTSAYPMSLTYFDKVSRPTVVIDEKTKKRSKSMPNSFVPRYFWDELYKASK